MKHRWINKPKFEKISWQDFWYYYKFHVIFGVFGTILLVSLLVAIFKKEPEPDLSVHYVGYPPVEQTTAAYITQKKLEPVIQDANGDGEKTVEALVKNLSVTFDVLKRTEISTEVGVKRQESTGDELQDLANSQPSDQELAMIDKIALDLVTGEPSLYIISGDILQIYMHQGIFHPLEDMDLKYEKDLKGTSDLDNREHVFAISVEGNQFLQKECNINTTGKYVTVRIPTGNQRQDPVMQQKYENALNALIHIVKNQ